MFHHYDIKELPESLYRQRKFLGRKKQYETVQKTKGLISKEPITKKIYLRKLYNPTKWICSGQKYFDNSPYLNYLNHYV